MNHQIQTLSCNLQLTNKALHEALQRQLMQFYDVGLFRVINRVFQKFEQYNWEFEEIQLELPPIAFHEFSTKYLVEVERVLSEYLEEIFQPFDYAQGKEVSSKEKGEKMLRSLDFTQGEETRYFGRLSMTEKKKSVVQIIISYLQKGYYSQPVKESFGELWKEAIQQHTKELLQKLSQNAISKVIKRLVHHLSESQLQELIQHKEASKELVSLVSQELLRESQSKNLDRKLVLKNLLKISNKEEVVLDSDLLEMLSFSEQEQMLSTIQQEEKSDVRTQQVFAEKKEVQPKEVASTSELILHFLQFGGFPQKSLQTSKLELDGLFEHLFTSNNLAQWRKLYRQYHHKGKGIHTWVLENYLSQEVHRIQYLIQLDSWVPLSKKATQSIKKGMQKKQNQHSNFAQELAANLLEEEVHQVVGYIEPENKDTVLYFVEATVTVVEIQSLTDKMTSFKKALYGFVLSYLLLKQGYSFHKKQFVANQIQQLARHFGMEYTMLLQLFLETLNPDATFGKEKELYEILQILQSATPKTSSQEEEFIKNEVVISTDVQSLIPATWSRLLVYFLEEEHFPKWSTISNFKELIAAIPIVVFTEEKVLLFLNSQRIIREFLDQKHIKKQGITSLVLLHCILHKKVPEFVKSQVIKALQEKEVNKNVEMSSETWTQIFLFYLESSKFPQWTNIQNIEELIALIPVEKLTEKELISFLKSQKTIVEFLQSSIVKEEQITMKELMILVLTSKEVKQKENQKIDSIYWTKVFVYYLEKGVFPNWTLIRNVGELYKQIPIQKATEKNILSFLESQSLVVNFLQSESAKSQQLTSEDLMILILNSEQVKRENKKEISPSYWVKVWIYYLENQRFPVWSFIQDLKELMKQIPVQNLTKENVFAFLQSKHVLTPFLNSKIIKKTDITLTDLSDFVLNPTSDVIDRKLKKSLSKRDEVFENQEEGSRHWISVFSYYLQCQKLPWWSTYTSVKQLLKKPNINKETRQELIVFLQKNKKNLRIWKTLNELSKEILFRTVLLELFIPNATQRKAIIPLVNIFSPLQQIQEKAFVKHFGVLSNGATFWQFLWNSRQILFTESQEKLSFFWKKLHQEYMIDSLVFDTVTWELLEDQKEVEVWKNILNLRATSSKGTQQKLTIPHQFIEELLFNTSKSISRANQLKLKNELRIAPKEFLLVIQKRLAKNRLSKAQQIELFSFWTAMLFPHQKKLLEITFKELITLEKYVKNYTSKDHDFFLLFLWKAVSRFQFKSAHQYIESLLLELAQYKRVSFEVLFTEFYEAIYQHQKLFPVVYKSLVILKLKQGFDLKKEEESILLKEEVINAKGTKSEEKLTQIQLSYAGIVLLWIFMSALFKKTNLWNSEEKEFYSEEAKNKAVFLLYFLVTGTTEYEDEHELLFMKLLCGLEPDFSVEQVTLEEEEIQLIEGLLEAAIAQWTKLGTVSIDGFRSTFLKRSGVLDEQEEGMNIRIESSGVDMLLDYLPWTISTLRLPWLEKNMYVSWR